MKLYNRVTNKGGVRYALAQQFNIHHTPTGKWHVMKECKNYSRGKTLTTWRVVNKTLPGLTFVEAKAILDHKSTLKS